VEFCAKFRRPAPHYLILKDLQAGAFVEMAAQFSEA
jgi:hypothetical protein